jgi:hypothetical protein
VEQLFATGRIADIIVAVMVAECLVLLAVRFATQRGPQPLRVIANLAAGLFLVLALRAALTQAGWHVMAACLAAALIAHLTDLRARWPN